MGYVPIGMAKNDTFRVYAREVKQTAEVKDLKRDEAKTATDVKAS
jgi:hypothetical protein